MVAPQYFAGSIQLGVISQSVGAFNHILSDLSVIVNDFEQLSSFSAGIERLSTFLTSMRDVDPSRSNEDSLLALPAEVNATSVDDGPVKVADLRNQSNIQLNRQRIPSTNGDNALMQINQLRLVTPDRNRVLIDNLDLTIREGQHLLISGSSGCGKSSKSLKVLIVFSLRSNTHNTFRSRSAESHCRAVDGRVGLNHSGDR